MGAKARRSIEELCPQGCTKGSNDINHLVLHNKRNKFACGPNTSRKEPNDITSCHFHSRSFGKAILEEPNESNIA